MTEPSTPGAAPAAPAQPPARRFQFPDTRGWVALGLFLLTAMIFVMIDVNPGLTSNQGFMFLAQAVIVSGLIGGVVAFLYTASKSGADANARTDKALDKVPDAQQ